MAIMHPRELLAADCKSNAERKVFDALRDQVGDDWDAYHSASVVVRDEGAGALDDECDFVLCHPEHGVVCLEVKGGGIGCNHGAWYRGGERIQDPFQQAIDHKHNVRRKLEEARGSATPPIHAVHALAFPDITVGSLVLAPDAPPELVWDRSDVRAGAAAALARAVEFHRGTRDRRVAPDPGLVRAALAPSIQIKVPMAEEFLEEEEALVTLTHEQAGLIARQWRTSRMAVRGCAGSGKTMIAVERAKRLARAGQKVLFVCFNKQLAAHLRRREKHDNVDYFTFHALCKFMASRAEVVLPTYAKGESPPQEYWDADLPAALMEACGKLGGPYDALIVDEAQDLDSDWFDALSSTLADPDTGSIWLFLDDNQRVYDARLEIPNEFRDYDLTVNCRNTQAIHREVMKYYEGDIEFEVRGPEGRDPIRYPAGNVDAAVATTLEFLVDQEEIPPQDIVVLSSHALERTSLGKQASGRFNFVAEPGKLGDNVHFSSIRAFKGLEAKVVVLCELEDLDATTRDKQLYVAISRARNHCVILERAEPRGD